MLMLNIVSHHKLHWLHIITMYGYGTLEMLCSAHGVYVLERALVIFVHHRLDSEGG